MRPMIPFLSPFKLCDISNEDNNNNNVKDNNQGTNMITIECKCAQYESFKVKLCRVVES